MSLIILGKKTTHLSFLYLNINNRKRASGQVCKGTEIKYEDRIKNGDH